MITVSLVSHGHGAMVERLVERLLTSPLVRQVVLTINIAEELTLPPDARVITIRNAAPQGFGANHNAAALYCSQPYFCVLNPDIELSDDPFPALIKALEATGAAASAPIVENSQGKVEASIRRFPTVWSLLLKLMGLSDGSYSLAEMRSHPFVDWVGGMFMLIRMEDFNSVGGFDDGYYLYYEDVDLCVRFWRANLGVVACPDVRVIHDAQRSSHRDPDYLKMHLASMGRYFRKNWGRLPKTQQLSLDAKR